MYKLWNFQKCNVSHGGIAQMPNLWMNMNKDMYRLSVMYHSSLLQYDVIVRSRYTRESTVV